MSDWKAHAYLALAALLAMPAQSSTAQTSRNGSPRKAESAPIMVPLGAGSPFRRLLIQPVQGRPCPSNGCMLSIIGITASGQKQDLTFSEMLTNGFIGTKAQMIGLPGPEGMPRLTYEQSNLGGENTFNVFEYDRTAARYTFKGTVDGYGKALEAPLASSPMAPFKTGAERSISYAGIATYKRLTLVQGVELKITNGEVSGTFGQRILGQTLITKLTGVIANGRCTLKIGQDTLVGPCDTRSFSGERLSKTGKVVGTFDFKEKSIALGEAPQR